MKVLGLMSGTSLDGLDFALVELSQFNGKYTYSLIASETIPYTKYWEDRLRAARILSGLKLTQLHIDYGRLLGDLSNQFLKGKPKPDLISSHGHTVFHQPNKGFTLQIGDLEGLAEVTGVKTVGDFRKMDVAKGGQGAPLVPIGDKLLYGEYDYCLNLGGISNYSYSDKGVRKAKDLTPCNIVSNLLVNSINLCFDEGGRLGSKGKVDQILLAELDNWGYYKKGRSLGMEDLEKDFLPAILNNSLSLEDKLRTYYEHISKVIGGNLTQHDSKTLITGGGAKNHFLIKKIQDYSNTKIIIPHEKEIDFKEAIIFAFMGFLKIKGEINILKSVTGASSDSISGVVI